MYRLRIKRSAERDLRRMPRHVLLRIHQHILGLRSEPQPSGVRKLKGNVEGWRTRLGDYRIVYKVDDGDKTVTIVRIRHRREAYR